MRSEYICQVKCVVNTFVKLNAATVSSHLSQYTPLLYLIHVDITVTSHLSQYKPWLYLIHVDIIILKGRYLWLVLAIRICQLMFKRQARVCSQLIRDNLYTGPLIHNPFSSLFFYHNIGNKEKVCLNREAAQFIIDH